MLTAKLKGIQGDELVLPDTSVPAPQASNPAVADLAPEAAGHAIVEAALARNTPELVEPADFLPEADAPEIATDEQQGGIAAVDAATAADVPILLEEHPCGEAGELPAASAPIPSGDSTRAWAGPDQLPMDHAGPSARLEA
ncbi:MAG: hypothetical protein KDK75_14395, partial [Alphaproteobacteria bacterium]|nr:hypothetical protein [Alphaproteobacteria bacterium]